VRLFLRKTSAWHRVNRLGYHSDIASLEGAVESLQRTLELPTSSAIVQENAGEFKPPEGLDLLSPFTFADGSADDITTIEGASSLLNLEELKSLAKEGKLQGKNKGELLRALRKASKEQVGLGWGNASPIKTDPSENKENKVAQFRRQDSGPFDRSEHLIKKILAITGPCIRLSLAPLKLFERVHLVFYRSTEWTDKSLVTLILGRIGRRNFPEYLVCRSTNIFSSRSSLLEFEAAIRTQAVVDNILEFGGPPGEAGLRKVLDIFEAVFPRWKELLVSEQQKEDSIYETGEGAYLRRFSAAWVYTRIIHKALHPLAKFKFHEREHDLLCILLSQHLFHSARRGAWYQRKALLEEHYMHAIRPIPALGEEVDLQKKHYKRIALRTCEDGLQDNDCHLIYHYDLIKRITKLEKSLNVPKREQHDFGHVKLAKPFERFVEGTQLEKNAPVKKRRGSGTTTPVGESKKSGKTVWLDEAEGDAECSVEAMCLSWYRSEGWKGYHSEGGIVRTLFAYLFFDILFLYIPNVFQTAYQTCPLDLHTDAFYAARASEINHRCAELGNGGARKLVEEVDREHREKATCVVGLDWSYSKEDLLEIVDCFDGEALAVICKVMAQEYAKRGGGVPDLFLWRKGKEGEEGEVCFSEVKSENDRLSDTQRLWIHVLTGAGVKVELCNAVARRDG
jgi:fanconi-associated nuclease 1